jgi:hypothetical protein
MSKVVDYINPSELDHSSALHLTSDSWKIELAAAWLAHFGVDSVRDLDLGVLEAISDFVSRGIAPTGLRHASSEDA